MPDYAKLLSETTIYYSELKPVRCFALDNKYVYFTRSGFNHFLWKGQTPRPQKDQVRRFKLLKFAQQIITTGVEIEYRFLGGMDYWTLYANNIKVIVRKGDRGPLHFFSIMNA